MIYVFDMWYVPFNSKYLSPLKHFYKWHAYDGYAPIVLVLRWLRQGDHWGLGQPKLYKKTCLQKPRNRQRANLGFWFDYIWNPLKPKHLSMLVRHVLDLILCGQKTCLKSGPHLQAAAHIKGHGTKTFLITCHHSCWQVHLSFCWGMMVLKPTSSGLRCRLKTSWHIEAQGLNNYWIAGFFH